jgi:hypothetical protein
MTNASFKICRNAYRQLKVELVGAIDEEIALCCERETRAQLSLVAEGSLQVLWDLSALTSYSFEARLVVVRLQRFLTTKAERTAYLAFAPAPRSLALWAARMGNDSHACIAADHESAEAWLSGHSESSTLVRPITAVRSERRRKASAAG